jgi:CubicO group peptidase (beta-lactamase class C family)
VVPVVTVSGKSVPKNFLKNVIMSYLRIFFILGLLFTASALAESDYAGQWQGSVLIPGSPLEVVVTLSAEEGALSGTIDIPAQGAVGLPLRDITVSDTDITFTIAGIPGDPTFRGILDGDTLYGDFSQGRQNVPFRLARTEEVMGRPDLVGRTPGRIDEDILTRLTDFIEQGLALWEIPGVAVAIVQDGEVVFSRGFGVTEARGAAIDADTLMMIGSSGKTLTSLLLATLVDAGVIGWDTPVQEILPEFAVAAPELSRTMTISNLMCACSGVPRRDLEILFNASSLSAEAVIASLATFEFLTGFGEAYQYSNQLVAAGGFVAAAATGAPFGELGPGYDQALSERVLTPLGMTATTFDTGTNLTEGRYALPHSLTPAGYQAAPLALERLLLPLAPAGAHWSSANDMARYLQLLLGRGEIDGQRVVSEANLRALWEPQVAVSGNSSYGLGWFVEDYAGLTLVEHAGNTLGFTSEFALLPEVGIGVVVLSNAEATNAFNRSVRERLFELVFEHQDSAQLMLTNGATGIRQLQRDWREAMTDLNPDEVTPLLGRYTHDTLGDVTLRLEGDTLHVDAGEFVTQLLPQQQGGFLIVSAPLVGTQVTFDEGGLQIRSPRGADTYTFSRNEP